MSTPVGLKNLEDRELEITWDDGAITFASYHSLRSACPCAHCVNEWTGERTLDPATVRPDVKPDSVSFIGNYAIKFTWSDAHDSGIYMFTKLRDLTRAKE